MRLSQRLQDERDYVVRTLTGVICDRCGATLATYAECPADLADPCPGFVAIDKAKQDFNAMHYDTVLGKDGDAMPESYAAELRAAFPNITEAGIASYWRARHLPTD